MRAYVESYGCAHNESDARIIKGSIIQQGCDLVTTPDSGDVIFLNTCGVKHATERKIIDRLKALLATGKRVVVCGCLPKMNLAELKKAGATEFLDTDSLSRVPAVLAGERVPFSTARENKHSLPCLHDSIAVIQISAGCLGNCAFCGTRNARGHLHSYPLDDIVRSCSEAIANGSREIWLTSEDTGVYGMDSGNSLPGLINAVTSLEGDFKVRIGMMNPGAAKSLLSGLLDAYSSDKVYKFAHIPVQSGSPAVLSAMRRQHTAQDYEDVASAFRTRFPLCAISTDVIVGFPGEADEDFQATLALLERSGPDITNVSKFYPRPNTEAALMDKVPTQVLKQRSVECSLLSEKISLSRNQPLVHWEFEARALEKGRTGGLIARAPNYKMVALKGAVLGGGYGIRITKAHPSYLDGEILYTRPPQ